jgi:cobalt-precorrin 5A hydrolase/precorrin-3B C17-methyltransferase
MAMTDELAIVLLGEGARPLARRLAAALPGARVHGRIAGVDVAISDVGDHLRNLFQSGTGIIGLCAAGILIRALAPVLGDKRREPPVVAVGEGGSAVVPLLGGHHGANDLARRIGAVIGVAPAITTAGDVRFGVNFEEPPTGWRLANPEHVKPFTAALLAGARARIDGAAPWLAASSLPRADDGALVVRVTESAEMGAAHTLIYLSATLAVGIGCERGADPGELRALVEASLADAGLAPGAVAGVFSLDLKMDEPAIHEVAAALGVPARFFAADRLEAETPRLANPSEAVFREVGCHGVAEAAALAAAGPDGRLTLPKRRSAHATCAIATAPTPIDTARCGQARGRLFVVGIGPGEAAWRTAEAEEMLVEATDLVGYGLYLDLLGPRAAGKAVHHFALGEEVARVEKALALAAEGHTVALVSSGDPGIYAMAALAFELIETGPREWRRVAVRVAPGISAMQAAAARVGAPLGHDFCAISLSDLLTPWPAIERRLEAAAAGDFVVALYNPVSHRRSAQLGNARAILQRHRPASTPVVLARNLGRKGESVRVLSLSELDASDVDMLTLVLVGSSATRVVPRGDGGAWVYTPRGYEPAARAKAKGVS